jgi:hypothetical protein
MKTLSLFTISALLIPATSLAPAVPAVAAANANVAFCKDYVAGGFDPKLNRGECISLTTLDNKYPSAAHASAVHWCDYLAENYPDDFEAQYAGSKKDCIADNE